METRVKGTWPALAFSILASGISVVSPLSKISSLNWEHRGWIRWQGVVPSHAVPCPIRRRIRNQGLPDLR